MTLDSGALIALERGKGAMTRRLRRARELGIPVTVPSPAVLEWWRGGRLQRDMLERLHVEPMTVKIAQVAGEALAQLKVESAEMSIDAAVMASAAVRGDVVYTSDPDDLERLREHFCSVRVLRATGRET